MKTITIEQAADALDRIARGETSEPAVVTVKGRPVAALVPFDELDMESTILMRNPEFREMLEEASKQVQETGGIPHEEIRRRFGLS